MALSEVYQYQLDWRKFHSSHVIRDKLYIWGGDQQGLTYSHTTDVGFSLKLDVFTLSTAQWSSSHTSSGGQLGYIEGIMGCGVTTIDQRIIIFGGTCNFSTRCCHNNLFAIDTSDNTSNGLIVLLDTFPMAKWGCGFISCSCGGYDYLLVLGGRGNRQLPLIMQPDSQYIPDCLSGDYFTNEIHIMMDTLGSWTSPIVTGNRPPPIYYCTLNRLQSDKSKAVLFGGEIVPKINHCYSTSDFYILSLPSDGLLVVKFDKFSSQFLAHEWPLQRHRHASTIIASGHEDYLLTMGGRNDYGATIADCWILNITTKNWSMIDLPESVCGRYYHSLSSVAMDTNIQWIFVTGGVGMHHQNITGANVTVIVEFEYCNGQWMFNSIYNTTQRQELLERIRQLRSPKPYQDNETKRRNEELTQEIIQLEQVHSRALQEKTSLIQQQQTIIQQKDTTIRTINGAIQQKNAVIRSKDNNLQTQANRIRQLSQRAEQLQEEVRQKNDAFQQFTHQIQTMQNTITAKNNMIERKETAITQLSQQITRYRDNPNWAIDKEEMIITEDVLGIGGWGKVKVGFFRGTKVAVKTLHENIVSDYYLQLFSREMDIASRIRHPNLLQFIGATRADDLLIVTELMFTSLRNELEKCPMTRPQVISISIDVACALNYLHSWRPNPILHRDVSSANVLLQPSGDRKWKAKLSDYGSANLQNMIQTVNPGNPVYSAPEALIPIQHSPAMDVYSFGILMMEMSTGTFPPSSSSEREVQIQKIKWVTVKVLIEECTFQDQNFRPTTKTLLDRVKSL